MSIITNLDVSNMYQINKGKGIFNKEDFPRFFDNCPVCHASLIEFVPKKFDNSIVQVCTADPPKKQLLLTSYQAKSHFYQTMRQNKYTMSKRITIRQELFIRQAGTDPSKYLLKIVYINDSYPKGLAQTQINIKNVWDTIKIDKWWNVKLDEDYRDIWKKAQAMQCFIV